MTPMLISQPDVQVSTELVEMCDRCGAAAKAVVAMPTGELAFCGHHANRYADRILASASRVLLASGFAWRGSSG